MKPVGMVRFFLSSRVCRGMINGQLTGTAPLLGREQVVSHGAKEKPATMTRNAKQERWPARLAGLCVTMAFVASSMFVGGCSQVPDAANPAEWYKSTVDFIAGEDETEEGKTEVQSDLVADRNTPAPGAEQPFPNLASVPETPRTSTTGERQQIVQGLVADRQQAQYSSEAIRRQGAPVQPLRKGTGTAIAAAASSPTPGMPVIATPVAPPPTMASQTPMAAASPPPGQVTLAPPPPPGSGVTETFRARLAQTTAQGMNAVMPPANALAVSGPEQFETVIVSSSGVIAQSTEMAAAPTFSALPPVAANELSGPAPAAPPTFGLPARGSVKVATIQFSNGSANLSNTDRRILRDVFALHSQRGGKVRVIGHASSRTRSMDPVLHKMVNFQVSVDRASAVARELSGLGMRREDILVDARSDSAPLYFEVMPTGEAGNRRTDVYLEN
jgi:outer membrane protein OmpA-like peptidoglycan-associated protein